MLETETDGWNLRGADYTPDPQVPGAWLVTLRNDVRVLAYVGGHPLAPDFEVLDQEGTPADPLRARPTPSR